MGNRSLDDFRDDGTVEPAVSTYVARRGECAACGASAERRWQGEDGAVCPDCKEW